MKANRKQAAVKLTASKIGTDAVINGPAGSYQDLPNMVSSIYTK